MPEPWVSRQVGADIAERPGDVLDVYRVVAWLGWVGNLIVAEYIIRTKIKRIRKGLKGNL